MLLLLDYELSIDGTGLDLAMLAAQHNPAAQIVILSARADQQLCRRQTNIPSLICWSKPFSMHDFAELLRMIDGGQCPICRRQPRESISVAP